MGFLYMPSILQHFNIPARAEDNVLATVDTDDFIIRAAGGAGGHTLEGRAFGQGNVSGG